MRRLTPPKGRRRDELVTLALLPAPRPGLRSGVQVAEEAAMITFSIDLWFLALLIGLLVGYLIGWAVGRR